MPVTPAHFDPDGPSAEEGGLFGLPFAAADCLVQVVPVPWEATASYGRGTRFGPEAVLRASAQIDLDDVDFGDFWRAGICLLPEDPEVARWAEEVEEDALMVIASGGTLPELAARVDARSAEVHARTARRVREILSEGRIPGVLGGDHSVANGILPEVCRAFPGLGVLHIDAHADLRRAFLGFRWSHASVFWNLLFDEELHSPHLGRLVGVGWRDLGRAERALVGDHPRRIAAFPDHELAASLSAGEPWSDLCQRIIECLPPQVYVSCDIDGLDPSLCPNTGTPVPGGLSWHQLQVLLRALSEQREVVGFDLVEVSPGPSGPAAPAPLRSSRAEWDANVGARVLYKLAGCAVRSRLRLHGPGPDFVTDPPELA